MKPVTLSDEVMGPLTQRKVTEALRDEEKYMNHLKATTLAQDMTLWEMEQMMRRDLIRAIRMEGYQSGEMLSEIAARYSALAHETWDDKACVFRISPYDDFLPAFRRAQDWAREQVESGSFFEGECSAGRDRRFITDNVHGLEAALADMHVSIRYDRRSQSAQVLDTHGEWIEINDRIEAIIRERIATLYSFIDQRSKTDRPKAVPARYSSMAWTLAWNAYLGDHEIDAFEEWLNRLPAWDMVPRLDTWLTQVGFEVDEDAPNITELVAWAARSILLVACLRTLRPGVKHDNVPVLIGPQGCGKSTALAHLLAKPDRDAWFTDALRLAAGEKSRVEALQGAVIVEAAEMSGATTADIESLKAFLSRTNDRVRLAYRRNPEANPRRCSIVGTANGSVVLPNDPTGNRRFVAIPIRAGDPARVREWLAQHRLQLWAEAWERARNGEKAWMQPHLRAAQEALNETVRNSDPILEDAVREWIEWRIASGNNQFQVKDVVAGCGILGKDESASQLPMLQVRRVSRALDRFGCIQKRVRRSGQQVRVWEAPESLAATSVDIA